MPTLQCVSREALKEYLWGWTDADQSSAIESHLTECEECERTVAELESDPERLIESIRDSRNSRTEDSQASTSGEESMPAEDAIENSAIARAILQAKEMRLGDEEPLSRWQPPAGDFGPYELLRPLGHGGMASVYLARHRQLGKQVAIKLLPSRPFRNDHYAARFQREIRTAGQLNHSAIVSATDAGEYAGTHFLVMEYIEGLDLSRVARLNGPLPIADACKIMQTVAIGLSHAHAEGIVHRDIKPSNLMLSQNGEVKILDFGLAQVSLWDEVSAELTTVGQLMGTLDYMAPEQAERPEGVDYRADLYSIGATLFRLLCGRAPLAAAPDLSPLVKLRLLASHQPPRLDTLRSDAPEELVEFVGQLLARDPGQRPASAAHVAEQLSLFSQGANLKSLIADAMAADVATDVATENRVHSGPIVKRTGAVPSQSTEQVADTAGKSHGSGRARSRFGWWLAASLLPLFIFSGVLITLETQKGQLVIESSAANVEVKLLREGEFYETLQIQPGANATRLYAGKYEVVVAESSDAVTFDRSTIEIKRGETVVARVTTPTVAVTPDAPDVSESQATVESRLPSSTRKLQVNDQIVVIGGPDPKMNSRVVVMSDLTIKLPWVGIVSVESESLDSLQAKLRERYAKFIREPMIDVYFGKSIQPDESKLVIDTAAASSGAPPRNDAVLQPGDAITVLNGNDTSEINRAVVLADSTLRLPLIGTFSVASETITTLERKLNELYKPYYRDPLFEVFRSIHAVPSQTPLASMNSAAKAAVPAELLYEGKTLAEWCQLFLHERSPAELEKAIAAMAALRTSGDASKVINDALLRTLPSVRFRSNAMRSAFALIYATQDNSAAYFQLLADQLRTGNAQWRESIFRHVFNSSNIAEPTFSRDFEPMRAWLVGNVLHADLSPSLTKQVVESFSYAVIDPNATAECRQSLLKTLVDVPSVGLDFWLGNGEIFSNGGVVFKQSLAPEFAAAIEAKAIEALSSDETPSKYVIQASIVLMHFNKSEFDRTGMPPRPDQKVLANAVALQIQRVLDDPARMAEKVKLDGRFENEALPSSLRNLANEKLTLLVTSRCNVRSVNGFVPVEGTRSYVLFQLFDLISDFKLQDELESAFTRIIELTKSEAIEFAMRVEQPFRSDRNSPPKLQGPHSSFLVLWPELSPGIMNSNSWIINQPATNTQCIHFLLLDRCFKLLPEGEARDVLLKNLQSEYERNYIRKVIEKMDRNADGKLSIEEAATDTQALRNLPIGDATPAQMDIDQDTFLSVDELLAAIADFASKVPEAKDVPASQEALLEWATQQIEKYDKN